MRVCVLDPIKSRDLTLDVHSSLAFLSAFDSNVLTQPLVITITMIIIITLYFKINICDIS